MVENMWVALISKLKNVTVIILIMSVLLNIWLLYVIVSKPDSITTEALLRDNISSMETTNGITRTYLGYTRSDLERMLESVPTTGSGEAVQHRVDCP